MSLFGSRKIRELEEENLILLRENTDLHIQVNELKLQRFTRATELEEALIDKLNLSESQISELRLIFSIERARASGVPEDQILHTYEEITKFFMSKES